MSQNEEAVYMGLPGIAVLKPKLTLAIALSLPVFCLSMASMIPGLESYAHAQWNAWIQFVLASLVFFWCGKFFLRRWWTSLRERDSNMFTLIVTGTGSAWIYSTIALLFGENFPIALKTAHGVPLYFEACAITTTIVLLGQIIEQKAHAGTEEALHSLMALTPARALRISEGGVEEDVSIDIIQPGDTLKVRPGETIPVDGLVCGGSSEVEEAILTGEPMPVPKLAGDEVKAGTNNTNGMLLIKAVGIGTNTLLAQIIRLVEAAQETEAPVQRTADRLAAKFVPSVAIIALLTFGAWLVFGPEPKFLHALVSAMAVLVVSCPCTLGLATPVAVVTGIGRGARAGILFKNAESLELLARAKTVFIDKTGTLTEGKPQVLAIETKGGVEENELIRLAASVESASEHPIARAILQEAQKRGLKGAECTAFQALPGKGVTGWVEGAIVTVERVPPSTTPSPGTLAAKDGTLVQVTRDGQFLGQLLLADTLRPEALSTVRTIQAMGIRIVILSGDRENAVAGVARELGIAEYSAGMLPAEKQACVNEARQKSEGIVFTGDGINDAPALAVADVGIAMGTGTGIAMASAGVVLLKGDITGLARALTLGRKTLTIIKQNLFWAFFYNGLCIPLAAGLLYPVLGWQLSPMVAGAAMCLSSLCVVGNALRLRSILLD